MITPNKPWAIYTRVSTDDQAREGVSLQVQAIACADMLRVLAYPGREVFEDAGHSAKDLDRPAAVRLLALVDAGELAGVIVYKLDRLTRSVSDLFALLKRFEATGTALVSVREQIDTSTAMGRFFIGLIGLIAQWEREQISERVGAAMRHRKAEGGFVGGRPPVGLVAQGDPGKRELVPHPDLGDLVREVWPRIRGGATLREVATWLDGAGVPSASGRWTGNGVHALARNERYIGQLVDRSTFDQTIDALANRHAPGKSTGARRTMARSQTHSIRTWLLTGLARCGQCKAAMIGVHGTNSAGTAFPYYRCGGRARKGRGFCAQRDLAAEVWEDLVMRSLMQAVADHGELLPAIERLQKVLLEEATPLRAQRDALVLERDAAEQRVRALAEVAASGGAIARGLAKPIGEAQAVVEALEERLASLDGQLAAVEVSRDSAEALVARVSRNLAGILDASPEDQAATLQAALASVALHGPKPGKKQGQVDLSINLPRAAEFVRQSSMVEHGARRTNLDSVGISIPWEVPGLREWRQERLA